MAAVCTGAGLLAAPLAVADTFPNNYDRRVADSAIHTYCLTSTFTLQSHIDVAVYAMT